MQHRTRLINKTFIIRKRWVSAFLILIIQFVFPSVLDAQDAKIEIEKRISKDMFPENAIKIAAPILPESKKIRFYMEVGKQNTTYELKLKYKKQRLSVEFSSQGAFEDIEVLRQFKTLDQHVQKAVLKKLKHRYKKHIVTRCQIQYKLKKPINKNPIKQFMETKSGFGINYEIEARVKHTDGSKEKIEFLFNKEGEILSQRKIQERNDDVILY